MVNLVPHFNNNNSIIVPDPECAWYVLLGNYLVLEFNN